MMKLTRKQIATITRLAKHCLKKYGKVNEIQAGTRENATTKDYTPDSRTWDWDDLAAGVEFVDLPDVEFEDGFRLDLYCYNDDGLVGNVRIRINGEKIVAEMNGAYVPATGLLETWIIDDKLNWTKEEPVAK